MSCSNSISVVTRFNTLTATLMPCPFSCHTPRYTLPWAPDPMARVSTILSTSRLRFTAASISRPTRGSVRASGIRRAPIRFR